MRVRSADVFQSGLQWHFVPSGDEELASDPSKAQRLPPLGDLLAGVIAPPSPGAPGQPSAVLGAGSASRQPRPDSAARLASARAPAAANGAVPSPLTFPKPSAPLGPEAEEGAGSPLLARSPAPSPSPRRRAEAAAALMVAETREPELELLPETALEPGMRMQSQVAATPPEPAAPAAAAPAAPAGAAALPPGFEVEIQAPALAAAAHDGGLGGGGFDYFTSTQLSPTQADHGHAWAIALAPGPLLRPSGLGLQQPQAAGPPPPSFRPPQPQAARLQDQPAVPRPPGSTAAPRASVRQQPQAGKRRAKFDYQPAEKAARRANTGSLVSELQAIFRGAGEGGDGGGGPAFEFGLAIDLFNKAGAAPPPPAAAAPVSLPASPSTEVFSESAQAAVEAAEAAAIEAKYQRKPAAAAAVAPAGQRGAAEQAVRVQDAAEPVQEGSQGRAVPPGGLAAMHAAALGGAARQATSSSAGWDTASGSRMPQGAAAQPPAAAADGDEAKSRSPSTGGAPGPAFAAAPGFLFTRASGRGVQIDPSRLAAAQALLGDGAADAEAARLAAVVHAAEIPESEPQRGQTERVPETPAAGAGASLFVIARSGAAVTASEAEVARARRRMALDGAAPPESPAAPPAVTPLGTNTTPELRRMVLNQRTAGKGATAARCAAATAAPSRLGRDPAQGAAHYVFGSAGDSSGDGWTVTPKSLRDRLLSAGASPTLATEAWTRNHYRWAVWKLARAEFASGPAAAGRLLTPEATEDELRRRYQREHCTAARPLLKAIFQHDEPAGALGVYMVASVRAGDGDTLGLELTDGWYWAMGRCDTVLTQQIRRGRIGPGTKLRVAGARLDAGPPGSPLDAATRTMLTLTANGVHPAPPEARLGRASGHLGTYLPLSGVRPEGGVVPQTLVVVLRRYPPLLWTKLPSGVATFQTPRAQAVADLLLEEERGRAATDAAAKVQAAEAARCAGWLAGGKSGGALTAVERLYATMVTEGEEFAASLNAADRCALEKFVGQRQAELGDEVRAAAAEALAAEIPAAADAGSIEVAMLLVGEVAHAGAGAAGAALAAGARPPAVGLITVWRAVEGVAAVREGEVYAVTGLEPRRSGEPGAPLLLPDAAMQLSASERASWRLVAPSLAALPSCLAGQAMPRAEPGLRGLVAVGAAAAAPCAPPGAGVFDFHGVLLKAGPVYEDVHNAAYRHYQWAFLADGSVGGDADATFLLAVKLQGPQDAVSWLEPGVEGGDVSLADLELQGCDEGPRVWRAAGGKQTAVAVGAGARANPAAVAAAGWARANPEVFKALQERVETLMAG